MATHDVRVCLEKKLYSVPIGNQILVTEGSDFRCEHVDRFEIRCRDWHRHGSLSVRKHLEMTRWTADGRGYHQEDPPSCPQYSSQHSSIHSRHGEGWGVGAPRRHITETARVASSVPGQTQQTFLVGAAEVIYSSDRLQARLTLTLSFHLQSRTQTHQPADDS